MEKGGSYVIRGGTCDKSLASGSLQIMNSTLCHTSLWESTWDDWLDRDHQRRTRYMILLAARLGGHLELNRMCMQRDSKATQGMWEDGVSTSGSW